MKNTKQAILDAARKLFNDLGYSQVTIRMIAMELGMSSGNLNYHFRKREDILQALYFEMVADFDKRIQVLDHQRITLTHMKTEIEQSMKRMVQYRFFWTDLYNLLQVDKKIKTHFQAVREDRIRGYQFVFQALTQQEILKAPSFSQEHLLLIQSMIHFSDTWLYVSSLYPAKLKGDKLIAQSTFELLIRLYPYLTKAGQHGFESLYPEVFTKSV
jgi:AcrR family transcriptional regulator